MRSLELLQAQRPAGTTMPEGHGGVAIVVMCTEQPYNPNPGATKNLAPRPEEFPSLLLNATSPSWTPLPPPTLQNKPFEMAKVASDNPAM
jgi:hypothetical protein